jgi:hypothetical protein
MAKANALEVGKKGTPLWAFNRYRTDALTSLLDDLVVIEDRGLSFQECAHVRQALEKSANCAAQIPDGWFRNVLSSFERLVTDYDAWNNTQGTDQGTIEQRRNRIKRLRRTRQKLATRVRKQTYKLANNLDLEIVKAQYKALEDLTKALPATFRELSKTINKIVGKI